MPRVEIQPSGALKLGTIKIRTKQIEYYIIYIYIYIYMYVKITQKLSLLIKDIFVNILMVTPIILFLGSSSSCQYMSDQKKNL